jgi:hypothetical protein
VVYDILCYKNVIYNDIPPTRTGHIVVPEVTLFTNTEEPLLNESQFDLQSPLHNSFGGETEGPAELRDQTPIFNQVDTPVHSSHTISPDRTTSSASSVSSNRSNSSLYSFTRNAQINKLNFTHTAFSLLYSGIVHDFIEDNVRNNESYPFMPTAAYNDELQNLNRISSIFHTFHSEIPVAQPVYGGGKHIRNKGDNTTLKYKNVNTTLRKHHIKRHNNTKTKAIKNVTKHKTIKKYKKKCSNNNTIKRRNR